MTNPQPLQAPEHYAFFTGEYNPPLVGDPEPWGITDPDGPDAQRVVLIHEACGSLVVWKLIATHEAWHASLGG